MISVLDYELNSPPVSEVEYCDFRTIQENSKWPKNTCLCRLPTVCNSVSKQPGGVVEELLTKIEQCILNYSYLIVLAIGPLLRGFNHINIASNGAHTIPSEFWLESKEECPAARATSDAPEDL